MYKYDKYLTPMELPRHDGHRSIFTLPDDAAASRSKLLFHNRMCAGQVGGRVPERRIVHARQHAPVDECTYVLLEPGAERLPQRAAHPPSERPAEKAEGPDARIVEGDLVRVANDRLVQLHDVGVVRAVLVARAVTAQDDVPGHEGVSR